MRPPPASPDRAAAPSPSGARPMVWTLAALAALAYTLLALQKYSAFLYTDFDLALFAQATHGVLHGSLFTSIRGMHWLGDHTSLVLIPLAPLTLLGPPARVLLAVQASALAFGALPVHTFARRRLGDERLAIACALLWLLQPALSWQALFEFHPETLAAPALLAAWVAMESGRTRAAALWAALALSTREDVALPVLAMALLAALALNPRRPRVALALALLAVSSLVLSFAILKPMFAAGADYGMLYRDWGATPRAIAFHLLRDPFGALLRLVSTPGNATDSALKLRMWDALLVPLAALPLFSPALLLPALPILAEHLLAWRPEQHSIYYQYTALSLPFFMLAAVGSLGRLRRRAPRLAPIVMGLALLLTLLSQAQFGALAWRGGEPGLSGLAPQATWPDGRERALRPERVRLLAALPARGDVAASFVFLAHLAGRDSVHALHHLTSGHYTFSTLAYPMPRDLAGLVCDYSWDDQLAFATAPERLRLAQVLSANDLHPVAAGGEMVTYARGARDTVALLSPVGPAAFSDRPRPLDPAFAFVAGLPGQLHVRRGATLPVGLRWLRSAPTDTTYCIELALVNAKGDDVASEPHLVGHAGSPPATWPTGVVEEETVRWVLPLDTRPGTYDLVVRFERIAGVELQPLPGAPDDATLGRLTVTPY